MVTQHLDWRWTGLSTLLVGFLFGLACFICTPETADPILLRRKAQDLRLKTLNFALHAECEEQLAHVGVFVEKYLTKPLKMIALEPIVSITYLFATEREADL